MKSGSEAGKWTEMEAAMLRAVDELHYYACVSDDTFGIQHEPGRDGFVTKPTWPHKISSAQITRT